MEKKFIALALFRHDGNLSFNTDLLNKFAKSDEINSASGINAYEGILLSCEILHFIKSTNLMNSSQVTSKSAK